MLVMSFYGLHHPSEEGLESEEIRLLIFGGGKGRAGMDKEGWSGSGVPTQQQSDLQRCREGAGARTSERRRA